MAFNITNVTRAQDIDDSVVKEWDAEFLTSFEENRMLDMIITLARQTMGGTWRIPRYDAIPVNFAGTRLTDGVDPDATRLTDTNIEFTPAEHGLTVAKTSLASLQTRGMIDRVAPFLVGQSAGQNATKSCILAMDAATESRTLRRSNRASTSAITAADIINRDLVYDAYQRLESANVPVIPAAGTYVLVVHAKVKADLVKDTDDGGFIDVNRYSKPDMILQNEIGMYGGFRVVVNNLATLQADAGVGNVDVYNSYACGFNAVGRATLMATEMRATGPFDSLGRAVSMGWYGIWQDRIAQPESLLKLETSSSYGNNA